MRVRVCAHTRVREIALTPHNNYNDILTTSSL